MPKDSRAEHSTALQTCSLSSCLGDEWALTSIAALSLVELVSFEISGPCSCIFSSSGFLVPSWACCVLCCLLQCTRCCNCLVIREGVLREKALPQEGSIIGKPSKRKRGDRVICFSWWEIWVLVGFVLSILERKVTYVFTPFVLRLLEELGSDLCKPVDVHRCSQDAGGLQEGAARPLCRLLPEEACRRFQTYFSFKCLFST